MRKLLLLATAATVVPTFSVPALAQSQADAIAEDVPSGDIVVTARRRQESAANVPISISAFSGETLESKGIDNLQEIIKITPGINISYGGIRTSPFITIRGMSRGVTGNINPGVITYVNDVPQPNEGSLVPTYDIANIQVLKGPQGTLFGRNSMGGAVLVNTALATHNFEGYVQADIAEYNSTVFEGVVNLPIIQDKVALRIAGQLSDGGDFGKTFLVPRYTVDPNTFTWTSGAISPLKHNYDEYRQRSFRASLLIEPSDGIRNDLVFDRDVIRGTVNTTIDSAVPGYFDGLLQAVPFLTSMFACGRVECDIGLAEQFTTSDRGKSAIITNHDPWAARTKLWSITNTTSIDISDHISLKNIFGYRELDGYNETDLDGTGLNIGETRSQARLKQISNELQVSGALWSDRIKYTIGAFYYKESPNGPGGNGAIEVNALAGLVHSIEFTYLTNTSRALFGQADFEVADGLTLTAGARQTWDSVSGCAGNVVIDLTADAILLTQPNSPLLMSEGECNAKSRSIASFPGSTFVLSEPLQERKFKKLTYTLGVNYKINDGTMMYVTHRRGYRAGSYNTPLFDQSFLGQIQTFGPETIEDFEAGAKIRWDAGGMRGSLDLAAFTGKDKNYQLPVSTANLTSGVCVPQAVTASRPADCTVSGVAGVTIAHPAATTILNAGELTIRGFEAAATISPVSWLTLGANVAHVKYKVDKVTLDSNLLAVLAAGSQFVPTTILLTQQPKWTYGFDVVADLPGKVLGSETSFNVNFKHVDGYPFNDSSVPGYNLVDARLTLANVGESGFDLSVFAKNLFNEYYYSGGVAATDGLGARTFIRGVPRQFGLSVKYTFGR